MVCHCEKRSDSRSREVRPVQNEGALLGLDSLPLATGDGSPTSMTLRSLEIEIE